MTIFRAASFGLLLASFLPLAAQAGPNTDNNIASKNVICRSRNVVGTLLKRRYCLTAAQWHLVDHRQMVSAAPYTQR